MSRAAENGRLLEGVKIVECGIYMALPICGRILAELGAEVIKVESQARLDPCYWIPRFGPSMGQTEYQGGKRRVLLNVAHPKAKPIMEALIGRADVFMTNYKRDVLERWGFEFDRIRKINPSVIFVWQTGMGSTGPYAEYKVFGNIAQHTSGVTAMTGFSDVPYTINTAYSDYHAAVFESTAIIAALIRRKLTGQGASIECSILKSAAVTVGPAFLDYQAHGRPPKKMGNRDPLAAPHGIYPCKGEDAWCAIAVFGHDDWEAFCQVLGKPRWTRQQEFASMRERLRYQDELDARVSDWTKHRTPKEIMRRMQEAGVAAGIVSRGEDLAKCDHLRERGFYAETTYYVPSAEKPPTDWEESDPVLSCPVPVKFSETPLGLSHIRRIGEDNEYVYCELLGIQREEFQQLVHEGVIY